ncbi:polysaccharide deacetylase family protein [Asticcacaulis sp. 201]|uniref:polysaccharide deacetylase family protein n=1 Tax=Asticcacaulis sp. 201 TaxID=3028787 RepID=UPI002915D6D4|nr:polysaccharide deacetylase family protein [Asticcacaulis sp. 201]MDV6330046.1 polysaccharide deacetylase family protein [Asticcacaulis sp. 201]
MHKPATPSIDRRDLIAGLFAGLGAGLALPNVAGAQPVSHGKTVAITFDDLPFASATEGTDLAEIKAVNRQVLHTLRAFGAPATGFVVQKSLEPFGPEAPRELLASWTQGAFSLGNHTYSHADTNALDLAGIAREVVDGAASIKPLMAAAGKRVRFVRFAMNHTGDTLDKALAIEALSKTLGYTPAASTIDTSDYEFEAAYRASLRKRDAEATQRIADAYVAYSAQQIDYYAALGHQVLGYEPPEVALLHLNRINAATLPRLLQQYVDRGYRFVTLDEAQSDPAYAIPTTYATKFGPMWGYRWAKEKDVHVDGSLEKDPPAWITDYAKAG